MLRFWIFWTLSALMEFPIFLYISGFKIGLSPYLMIFGHFIASILLFFAVSKKGDWLGLNRHWLEPFVIWNFVFPGIGWIFSIVLWLSSSSNKTSGKPFILDEEDAEEDISPVSGLSSHSEPENRYRLHERTESVPAVDILMGHDDSLKQSAMQTLAKIRTPESISWILKVRMDPSPDVRLQATNTLTNLKHDYQRRLKATELEILKKPGDLQLQIDSCGVTYEYAISGLVDSARRHTLIEECYKRLIGLAPYHSQAVRLLFHVEKEFNLSSALSRIKELKVQFPDEEARWSKEEIQLLFHLGRYDEVYKMWNRLEQILSNEKRSESRLAPDYEWESALIWWKNK